MSDIDGVPSVGSAGKRVGVNSARSADCAVEYIDLPGHSRAQRFLLRWIDRYRRAFAGRPSPCRFFPTCSEYGADAIHLHGAGRGSWLTVRRLLRCRPLGPSGYDPVPLPDHPEA